MAFHEIGKTVTFPRNEHVNIVVRTVMLNTDAPTEHWLEYLEIREFIRASETFGNGVLIPIGQVDDLLVAIDRVRPVKDSSQ